MVQTLSIRTKLIMAMLALVASVALMGVTADAANAAGVTEIRWVENQTPFYVYVWNHESGASTVISPNSAVSYNQWVPWATNADEFNRGKYIELGWLYSGTSGGFPFPCLQGARCPELAIWQEGDKIRYTRSSWYEGPGVGFQYRPSAPMAGASNTGGRRILKIRHTIAPTNPRHAIMQAGLCC